MLTEPYICAIEEATVAQVRTALQLFPTHMLSRFLAVVKMCRAWAVAPNALEACGDIRRDADGFDQVENLWIT